MEHFWHVPPMWAGQTVVVLASGQSLTRVDAEAVRLAGAPTLVTNNTFRLAPWADLLYAADAEWWAHPSNTDAAFFGGLRASVAAHPGVQRLRNTGLEGFDPTPGTIRTGSNSGYQCVHIAMQAGAKRILLLGFDMHGTHWHGRHVDGLRETAQVHYGLFIERFKSIVAPAEQLGVQIVNCTPGSALPWFPRSTLQEQLCHAP